ncbi:MAG: hypothetical protein CFE29_20785 [Bradyrhizobiaceae bacterium PARB1]|nr:MAG: hypothetical protein CFE29_20785 [Bradyrhizobiaceae bacterium PARB1]
MPRSAWNSTTAEVIATRGLPGEIIIPAAVLPVSWPAIEIVVVLVTVFIGARWTAGLTIELAILVRDSADTAINKQARRNPPPNAICADRTELTPVEPNITATLFVASWRLLSE